VQKKSPSYKLGDLCIRDSPRGGFFLVKRRRPVLSHETVSWMKRKLQVASLFIKLLNLAPNLL
ncbi:hypothetical protein, partial [Vibrio campbellii]|uniref:hypothetical protein n=1 Tax=Vibrio campbellii TaxID=680 RepID=UPI001BDA4814